MKLNGTDQLGHLRPRRRGEIPAQAQVAAWARGGSSRAVATGPESRLGRGPRELSASTAGPETDERIRAKLGLGPQAGLRATMKVKVYEFVLFFFRSVFEVL
jgi:hypothetical protein